MKAHFYGSKAKGFTVIINDSPRPIGGIEIKVANKREAIKVAKEHNAERHNF